MGILASLLEAKTLQWHLQKKRTTLGVLRQVALQRHLLPVSLGLPVGSYFFYASPLLVQRIWIILGTRVAILKYLFATSVVNVSTKAVSGTGVRELWLFCVLSVSYLILVWSRLTDVFGTNSRKTIRLHSHHPFASSLKRPCSFVPCHPPGTSLCCVAIPLAFAVCLVLAHA